MTYTTYLARVVDHGDMGYQEEDYDTWVLETEGGEWLETLSGGGGWPVTMDTIADAIASKLGIDSVRVWPTPIGPTADGDRSHPNVGVMSQEWLVAVTEESDVAPTGFGWW